MRELSLHLLDIVQNSLTAGASCIEIDIVEDHVSDWMTFSVKDNGCGLSEEFVKRVLDPFSTTRTTRKVGLGLSLFRTAAKLCEGDLTISSTEGVGTEVNVTMKLNHIDRPPLGDMAETVSTLVMCNPDHHFIYRHTIDGTEFMFDTEVLKEVLGEVPLNNPEVVQWMKEFIIEGLSL